MGECYLCKLQSNELPLCQDCGRKYCDKCFDTPCHDLCLQTQYHFTAKECPHWPQARGNNASNSSG